MAQAPTEFTANTLLALLEDRGHRLTGPRRTVARAIAGRGAGFTAEELCSDLPNVGRATVYRTIRLLVDAEVLCKLMLPNGNPRYLFTQATYHHHHAVCVSCGAVQEFRDSTVERLLKAVGTDLVGDIVGHRIELYVTCDRCTRRAEPHT
ncbi:MAG: transcriptional repressor [SAR202 cluster bacterium]|nr:transcriptional repressor [SAR202 cluster bacterium]